jgi:hypothetical protein
VTFILIGVAMCLAIESPHWVHNHLLHVIGKLFGLSK